ncbi:MAG: acyl phosphate:glycerol-3-phosphate acyltransferase [Verrucomicrobiota bacterium]|jgi:glycerol-3-phosphate acyltransferase PlsY
MEFLESRVVILSYVTTALAAYLLGSIPTGFLVAKARGIDIRSVGSGNIGATNVLRVLGKPAGIAVLLVDALKGWTAVVGMTRLILFLFAQAPDSGTREVYAIVAAVFAILGHNYTCWLGFKGGKGIATSAGVLTALVPWALGIILATWLLLFASTRIVSVASIGSAFTLPFASWFTTKSWTLTAVTGAMGALAIYKHGPNIQRLLAGTEPRFGQKKSADAAAGEAAK